jgi:hypothetical protein
MAYVIVSRKKILFTLRVCDFCLILAILELDHYELDKYKENWLTFTSVRAH